MRRNTCAKKDAVKITLSVLHKKVKDTKSCEFVLITILVPLFANLSGLRNIYAKRPAWQWKQSHSTLACARAYFACSHPHKMSRRWHAEKLTSHTELYTVIIICLDTKILSLYFLVGTYRHRAIVLPIINVHRQARFMRRKKRQPKEDRQRLLTYCRMWTCRRIAACHLSNYFYCCMPRCAAPAEFILGGAKLRMFITMHVICHLRNFRLQFLLF